MFIFSRSTLLAVGVLIFISCGKKDVERTPPPPSWAPGISQDLARSAAAPSCVLDNIGPVANPAGQKSIEVSGATTFAITGWAIDEANKTTAGGVDEVIDGTPYGAHYGSPRTDVAAHFNHPDYRNSGFELMVAPGQLAKGPHSVSIRVISSDKKSYYQGPVVQFTVN
jgi:hypothetical protein